MLEPISIEAYRCPKCHIVIQGSKEKASEHVNIPGAPALREGFVYKNDRPGPPSYIVTLDDGRIVQSEGPDVGVIHTFKHKVVVYQLYWEQKGAHISYQSGEINNINSGLFFRDIKKRRKSLLTSEELEKFVGYYSNFEKKVLSDKRMHFDDFRTENSGLLGEIRFVRTTPELEAILNS